MRSSTAYRFAIPGAILVVLLNAWIALHAVGTLLAAERLLAHTLEVLRATDETLVQYSTANASARAYLLTAEPLFASRYRGAERGVATSLETLQELTGDSRSQQQRIAVLRKRIALKMATLDTGLAMRSGRPDRQVAPEVLHSALSDMPDGGISVKYALSQITAEEDRLLHDRTAEAGDAREHVILTIVGASLLDLALLVLAFRLLINSIERRQELAARSTEILALNSELTLLNAELESRVEERTLELQAANKELEAFSYSVSHDLRAPLRTIDGFSLALQEDFADVLNDEGRDFINRVRAGVQRMGTLIDALLQLSRVTRTELQREPVNLSQLATNVFNDIAAGEPERRVIWRAEPGRMADADPRLMRVAFENLIGNAWKFTAREPDARITFGSTQDEGGPVYFIEDNGAGFDMAYVDRLFTAFQRLHGDRDFKGSGIGLATVSRIIHRHLGQIRAESQVGHGATFSFTLAAGASPGVAAPAQQEPATV